MTSPDPTGMSHGLATIPDFGLLHRWRFRGKYSDRKKEMPKASMCWDLKGPSELIRVAITVYVRFAGC